MTDGDDAMDDAKRSLILSMLESGDVMLFQPTPDAPTLGRLAPLPAHVADAIRAAMC